MKLGDTLASLRAFRKAAAVDFTLVPSRLVPLQDFGSNPGGLTGYSFVPAGLKPGAALVVVLHGCTQSAASYDAGAGWTTLAEKEGFAVLFAEQSRSNNPNRCFNWFVPADVTRGEGEVASIHQMIVTLLDQHPIDHSRVFITGLSAGGAMAASMLAVYPETFAAGAIIAGIAHGVADTVPAAFERMRGKGLPAEPELQRLLSRATRHKGAFPRISIWQGSADATVVPGNADAIFAQWRAVHQLSTRPDERETIDGARRRRWLNSKGSVVLESWEITGMGHGTPIAPQLDGLGQSMPYMLDVGVSSTAHIAAFFEITADAAQTGHAPTALPEVSHATRRAADPAPDDTGQIAAQPLQAHGPETSSETAPELKTASDKGKADAADRAGIGNVGDYVTDAIERALPGRGGMIGTIKNVIEQALKKAGLR